MGIKFRCPNGHKLNVKSFLAGKRGVCPECGQTFRIPPEGTDDSSVVAMPLESRRGEPAAFGENLVESDFETAVALAAASVAPEAAFSIQTTTQTSIQPQARLPEPSLPEPSLPKPSAPAATGLAEKWPAKTVSPAFPVVEDVTFLPPKPAGAATATPAMKPVSTPATAPAPPAPKIPPPPADPIDEAPEAVWYVRPPDGGQYGPARGEIMRKWLAEGRVSSDSLVWRDGWSEWCDAGKLFANLSIAAAPTSTTAGMPTPAAAAPTALPSVAAVTTAAVPRITDRKPAKKKANSDLAVAALVCLVLVCLILVTVLVIVLTGSA